MCHKDTKVAKSDSSILASKFLLCRAFFASKCRKCLEKWFKKGIWEKTSGSKLELLLLTEPLWSILDQLMESAILSSPIDITKIMLLLNWDINKTIIMTE